MKIQLAKSLKAIAAAEAKLQAKKEKAKQEAVDTANAIIKTFGLKASDLTFSSRTQSAPAAEKVKKATRAKVAPKYRNEKGETWTGRGKKPRWLAAALTGGAKLEDFLIDKK